MAEENLLRAARLAAGLKVAHLARRAGVYRRTIYLIEAGRPGTVETYRRLGAALGVPPASLVGAFAGPAPAAGQVPA